MHLLTRLQSQQQRKMIDQEIVDVTLFCEQKLKVWGVDTLTSQVNFILFHLAMALGRIKRGYQVLPLDEEFFSEIEQSPLFYQVQQIHTLLLQAIPFAVPASEQTHFIANIYALALEQPVLLKNYSTK